MNRETTIWTLLFVLGGLGLLVQCQTNPNAGRRYVVPLAAAPEAGAPEAAAGQAAKQSAAPVVRQVAARAETPGARLDISQTAGLWIGAILTLCIFSFLYRDNVFYKFAESLMVGTTAGYMVVAGFWDSIVAQLLAKLTPDLVRQWAIPGLPAQAHGDATYLIPLGLGVLLLWRLMPFGGWISRWPLAFIVGMTAGLRLTAYFDADFLTQIRSTILPLLILSDGRIAWWLSLRNVLTVVGVVSCLTYFFFSLPHRGVIGNISRVGVWFLMITFGASFALTVMGRIALLAGRLEFLFRDWLGLIGFTAGGGH